MRKPKRHWMAADFGFLRSTHVKVLVEQIDGIAGQMTCHECGGDGDWTKFYPEPEKLTEPLQCVTCKGTGKVWVSI